jgi:hypothetical protein
VPKFELYKHNDELFNIYYGIFYELWTFAYFDWLCKLIFFLNEKLMYVALNKQNTYFNISCLS